MKVGSQISYEIQLVKASKITEKNSQDKIG